MFSRQLLFYFWPRQCRHDVRVGSCVSLTGNWSPKNLWFFSFQYFIDTSQQEVVRISAFEYKMLKYRRYIIYFFTSLWSNLSFLWNSYDLQHTKMFLYELKSTSYLDNCYRKLKLFNPMLKFILRVQKLLFYIDSWCSWRCGHN